MKKSTKILLFIGVILLLVFIILFFLANKTYIGLKKDTFGIRYKVEKELFSYETDRDFHGDGFSMYVEKIDRKSQEYFLNPPNDFFSAYPKRDYHSRPFSIHHWKKTPQINADTIETAFTTKISTDVLDPEATTEQIRNVDYYLKIAQKLLRSDGYYYAFSFEDHPTGLYASDLYIISPKDGIIISINRQ